MRLAKLLLLALVGILAAFTVHAQSTYTDRFAGSVVATIGKQPVVAATTAAISLTGSQTIDGVVVSDHTNDSTGKEPDRVLVMNQADTTTNGIYVVNNSGAWYRSQDFSGPSGVVSGQIIIVNGGSTNVGLWTLTTGDPVSIDGVGGGATSNITFSQYLPTLAGGTVGTLAVTGNETVGGTLGVTGNETVGGTLGVTGASTIHALSATTGTFSSTLGVTGHTTFEGVTSTGATGTGNLVYSISPAFTTSPTAPTQTAGDNSTKLATTAYVNAAVSSTAPTIQAFTSSTGTYTTPAGVKWIQVRMIGGGGGGGGSGNHGANGGSTGGNTTFGTSLLVANAGVGGSGGGSGTGGAGGTASLGSGPIGLAFSGASGFGYSTNNTGFIIAGGAGAGTPFSGPVAGAPQGVDGQSATSNTGCGGQGGGQPSTNTADNGNGGGAGGYIDAIIAAPSATYAYAIGSGGAGGATTTGGHTGGAGGSGYIIVTEHYNY